MGKRLRPVWPQNRRWRRRALCLCWRVGIAGLGGFLELIYLAQPWKRPHPDRHHAQAAQEGGGHGAQPGGAGAGAGHTHALQQPSAQRPALRQQVFPGRPRERARSGAAAGAAVPRRGGTAGQGNRLVPSDDGGRAAGPKNLSRPGRHSSGPGLALQALPKRPRVQDACDRKACQGLGAGAARARRTRTACSASGHGPTLWGNPAGPRGQWTAISRRSR